MRAHITRTSHRDTISYKAAGVNNPICSDRLNTMALFSRKSEIIHISAFRLYRAARTRHLTRVYFVFPLFQRTAVDPRLSVALGVSAELMAENGHVFFVYFTRVSACVRACWRAGGRTDGQFDRLPRSRRKSRRSIRTRSSPKARRQSERNWNAPNPTRIFSSGARHPSKKKKKHTHKIMLNINYHIWIITFYFNLNLVQISSAFFQTKKYHIMSSGKKVALLLQIISKLLQKVV